jgi:phosphinothricin acetyltransferase
MADALDDLGDVAPEGFVAARDVLARHLKEQGDRAGADAVKRLRRPSVPTWVAGRLLRHGSDALDELRAASLALAEAQRAAVAAGSSAADREAVREATTRRRAALAAVGRAVDRLLADEDRPGHHREEVLRTIEAAIVAEIAPGVFGLPDDLELPEREGASPTDGGLPPIQETASADHQAGPGPMVIRAAVPDDLVAVAELHGSSPVTIPTPDRLRAWFAARTADGGVVLVAERDGELLGVAGYGPFRDDGGWPSSRFTVEHSIHVRDTHRRRGLGGRLLEALVEAATDGGMHVMVVAVDGRDDGSLGFHTAHGFVEVARMPEVGWAGGHWLDLVLLQRRLDPTGPHR